MDNAYQNILFYDGDCGFCNSAVQFVLDHEKNEDIYFSSLQSAFSKRFFQDKGYSHPDLSTFYFYTNHQLYCKSKAALKVTTFLSVPYSFLILFSVFPRFIRDAVYDAISKRRFKLSNEFCVLPEPQHLKRFLK